MCRLVSIRWMVVRPGSLTSLWQLCYSQGKMRKEYHQMVANIMFILERSSAHCLHSTFSWLHLTPQALYHLALWWLSWHFTWSFLSHWAWPVPTLVSANLALSNPCAQIKSHVKSLISHSICNLFLRFWWVAFFHLVQSLSSFISSWTAFGSTASIMVSAFYSSSFRCCSWLAPKSPSWCATSTSATRTITGLGAPSLQLALVVFTSFCIPSCTTLLSSRSTISSAPCCMLATRVSLVSWFPFWQVCMCMGYCVKDLCLQQWLYRLGWLSCMFVLFTQDLLKHQSRLKLQPYINFTKVEYIHVSMISTFLSGSNEKQSSMPSGRWYDTRQMGHVGRKSNNDFVFLTLAWREWEEKAPWTIVARRSWTAVMPNRPKSWAFTHTSDLRYDANDRLQRSFRRKKEL